MEILFCLHFLILTVFSLSGYVFWKVDISSLSTCAVKLTGKAGFLNSFAFFCIPVSLGRNGNNPRAFPNKSWQIQQLRAYFKYNAEWGLEVSERRMGWIRWPQSLPMKTWLSQLRAFVVAISWGWHQGPSRLCEIDKAVLFLELGRGEIITLDPTRAFYCSLSLSCIWLKQGLKTIPLKTCLILPVRDPFQPSLIWNGVPTLRALAWSTVCWLVEIPLYSVRVIFSIFCFPLYISQGLILALGLEAMWLYVP